MAEEEIKVENTETEQPDVDSLKAELERLKSENGKLKNAQSNASSEAAKFKKMLNERMSEQEREAAETKDLIESLRAENERMKKDQEVSVRNTAFMGVGFDNALARQAAESYGSNFEDFMTALTNFITAHDKALQAGALRATPRPGAGAADPPAVTKEQFDKMNYSERVNLFNTNPELYHKLNE